MRPFVYSTLLCTICAAFTLSACSSSGGDGNTTGGNTGATTDNTTGGTTTSGSSVDEAGLSHSGTALPSSSPSANDPLFSDLGKTKAAGLPDNLGVIYEVVENHGPGAGSDCNHLGAEWSSCSVANIHIKDAAGTLNDGNWRIYFHSIRRILRSESDEFAIALVNGDLNYIEPTAGFEGFNGDVKTIKLTTEFSHLVETDFMPRYWLVKDGAAPILISNTDSETDENTYATDIVGDQRFAFIGEGHDIADFSNRFTKNSDVNQRASILAAAQVQSRIVPKPLTVTTSAGSLNIGAGFSFAATPLPAAAKAALAARQNQFMSSAAGATLNSAIDSSLNADQYSLDVAAGGITINAGSEESMFWAANSLLSLVQPGLGTIPYVNVVDQPRFDFRGIHIDVARNFHSAASLKRLMDQMAAYKLNKLHLHLSDDEGWRLAIAGLPELTTVGATRQFQTDSNANVIEANGLMPQLGSGPTSNNQGSGFYTRNDFIDLLRYAQARYIEVIPEFDMPAHARAAVVAMRARANNLGSPLSTDIRLDDPADTSRYLTVQHYDDGILNPCLPATYTFVETVVTDVKSMYTEAGQSLDVWHMGGDEAKNVFKGGGFANSAIDTSVYDYPWEKSPACVGFMADTAGVNSREDLTPYFIQRVSQIVADAGIPALYAYQDILGNISPTDLATTRAGVGFWEMITAGGYESINAFSNKGFETVVAVPDFLYFDFPYEVDPKERGYYWATRFTDTQKVFAFAPENLPQNAETSLNREGRSWSATGTSSNQGFRGMQGQLWSETVRTPEQFDYMLFPRLIAMAERAWHKADWERDYVAGQNYSSDTGLVDKASLNADYATFAAALGAKELRKLDAAGVNYRIPVPGASTGATVDMNVMFPGLPLQYSSDGNTWQDWTTSNKPATAGFVRALSADGTRVGRATAVE